MELHNHQAVADEATITWLINLHDQMSEETLEYSERALGTFRGNLNNLLILRWLTRCEAKILFVKRDRDNRKREAEEKMLARQPQPTRLHIWAGILLMVVGCCLVGAIYMYWVSSAMTAGITPTNERDIRIERLRTSQMRWLLGAAFFYFVACFLMFILLLEKRK